MSKLVLTDRIEHARAMLASCRTIDQWKAGSDKAAALLELAKRRDAASEAHADAWELVQIANRCLGELCRDLPQGKPGRKPATEIVSDKKNVSKGDELERLKLTPKKAAELEKVADIPWSEFQARVGAGRLQIQLRARPSSIISTSAKAGYDSDTYGTPEDWAAAGREVLGGGYDLDPCSNESAQKVIRAKTYWTKADDCLQQKVWKAARLWLNPPFSHVISAIIEKLLTEVDAGNVKSGIVLVNNQTDTEWFHSLLDRYPMHLPKGRIHFLVNGKAINQTRQGQALFAIGADPQLFKRVFEGKFGGKVLVAA